jgi:hypothetical protein
VREEKDRIGGEGRRRGKEERGGRRRIGEEGRKRREDERRMRGGWEVQIKGEHSSAICFENIRTSEEEWERGCRKECGIDFPVSAV